MTKQDLTKQVIADLKKKGLLNEKALAKYIIKKKLNESHAVEFNSIDDMCNSTCGQLKHYEGWLKKHGHKEGTLKGIFTFNQDGGYSVEFQ